MIDELKNKVYEVSSATIYTILYVIAEDEFLKTEEKAAAGKIRKYYLIKNEGEIILKKEVVMFKLEKVKFKNIIEIDELRIEDNMVTAVLGPSGGGKTTFLKLLNNMISADSGKIYYKNRLVEDYEPVKLRRKVVMLPQDPQIFKGSIKDNFKLTEELTANEYSDDKVYKNLLKKVSLDKNLLDAAEKLSGGERQRLALARVMLLEPDTLLLDEPSSSLDMETEEKIIDMVVKYAKNNCRTMIMVTHSPDIADQFADKIIKINKGKIA